MIKQMHIKTRVLICSILLTLVSVSSQALEIKLDKTKVELALSAFFPLVQNFGGIKLTLQNPGVDFSGKRSRLYLNSYFSVIENGRLAEGKLRISSELGFEARTNQIQLKEPVVESIEFFQNDSATAKSVADVLEQQKGKIVPVIILFDLDKLGYGNSLFTPKNITVTDVGIVLVF